MKAVAILLLLGMCVLSADLSGEMITATHTVTQTDPAEDVRDSGDDPGKDMVKIVIDTDGTNMNITVVLDKEAKYYLDGHQAGDVVDVIIDADCNSKTGGKPFFYQGDGGFDLRIEVGMCIEYANGGTACAGALGKTKAINFFSTYDLDKYTQGTNTEDISETFNWKDRGKDIQGANVEVSVPYALMKLSPGQKIRLAVKERDDATFKKEYLPEVLLTVR